MQWRANVCRTGRKFTAGCVLCAPRRRARLLLQITRVSARKKNLQSPRLVKRMKIRIV